MVSVCHVGPDGRRAHLYDSGMEGLPSATVADPIRALCARDYYPASRTSGRRPLSAIKWIVLHSTEGGTAASVARYFKGPSASGSTHLVVDDVECQRCLPNSARCWGAKGANLNGFHIEQCGFARWSSDVWKSHRATLERAAYKTALHCDKFGIPPVFCNAADLEAGTPGHDTCRVLEGIRREPLGSGAGLATLAVHVLRQALPEGDAGDRLLEHGDVGRAFVLDQAADLPAGALDDLGHLVRRDDEVVEPRTDEVAVAHA
jgi:N-acetylmuramoyl-L-alanine amidase